MKNKGKHVRKRNWKLPVLLLFILLACGLVRARFLGNTIESLPGQEQISEQTQIPDIDPGDLLTESSTGTGEKYILQENEPVSAENAVPLPSAAPTEEPSPPTMLDKMAQLYAKNPDIVGWIKIDNTNLDYPVMYSPEEAEKYLHLNFEEVYSFEGLPFIDKNCSVNPESDNLLIYGHNMNDGSMFHTLLQYETSKYWQEHQIIRFSTLYEERKYEVMAAFYDRVYYKWEDCFKFYKFIDATDEEDFNNTISILLSKALYDTGVSAKYGDSIITLVTCAYHVDNGRFVVVAREIPSEA